jgi:glycerophosphoryl diester phosphodiesterase
MDELVAQGVEILAPPMWMLVDINASGEITASTYAKAAKAAGLEIITWTIERSGLLKNGGGWYYQTTTPVINNDGDVYTLLNVLAKEVKIMGVFSDWPATVTYYANCMKLD